MNRTASIARSAPVAAAASLRQPSVPRPAASDIVSQAGGALAHGERWQIWRAQLAAGREPCFGTPQRFLCEDAQCSWREHCLGLRAEWLR
jgi:hypothetical protein